MFDQDLKIALEELGRRAKDCWRVRAIVLFGSHARGEAADWSDVDIAVVSPDFAGKNRFERMWDVGSLWMGRKHAEIFGFTEDEVMRFDNPVVWEIVEEGKVLWDDGFFAVARERLNELKRDGLLKRVGRGWEFRLDEIRERCA